MDHAEHCNWIHAALHNPQATGVRINGSFYPVEVGQSGVRYLRYKGEMFMEQNKSPTKTTKWANMARTGRFQITWVVREAKGWGRIVSTPGNKPKIEVP